MKMMFALILLISVVPISALKSSYYDSSSERSISNYLSHSLSKNVSQGTGLLNCETESKLTSYTANRSTLSTGSPLTYDHLEPDRYRDFRSNQTRRQRGQNRAYWVGVRQGADVNDNYGYVVLIGFDYTRSDNSYVGTLITQKMVISASYWLVERSAPEINTTYMWDCGDFVRSIKVRVGSKSSNRGGSLIKVKSLHRNPNAEIKFGVLLLELMRPANLWVIPLAPPFQEKIGGTDADKGIQHLLDRGAVCQLVGWPLFSGAKILWYPEKRHYSLSVLNVQLINWTKCSRYQVAVHGQDKRLVCARKQWWECTMHYGAPVICNMFLMAVQPITYGCDSDSPKVYSLIGGELEWISSVVTSLEQTKIESMQVTYTTSSCYLVISAPLLTTTTAFLLLTTTN